MSKKKRRLKEIYFELPFEFFLANDAKDFDDFMEWTLRTKHGHDSTDYVWRLKGTRYGKHDGSVDAFFLEMYDMPYNSPGNYTEQGLQPILDFEINFLVEEDQSE